MWFRPMGLNLRVETEDTTLLRLCKDMFGGFGSGDPQRPADLQFNLQISSRAIAAVSPNFQIAHGSAYAYADAEQVIHADLEAGTVQGFFPQALLRHEAVLRSHYLQFALAVLLTARGFTGIHAAALEKNGRTVLVRGPRGSGKSVLAYAAVERDWRILADSTVWICPKGDWWGIPWWLYLRRSAAALFRRLAIDSLLPVADEEAGEGKLEIPVEQIRVDGSVTSGPAGGVVFLERNSQRESWLKTVTQEESAALWPAGASGGEAPAPKPRRLIERILESGGYKLYFGRNLDQAIELLDQCQNGWQVPF